MKGRRAVLRAGSAVAADHLRVRPVRVVVAVGAKRVDDKAELADAADVDVRGGGPGAGQRIRPPEHPAVSLDLEGNAAGRVLGVLTDDCSEPAAAVQGNRDGGWRVHAEALAVLHPGHRDRCSVGRGLLAIGHVAFDRAPTVGG